MNVERAEPRWSLTEESNRLRFIIPAKRSWFTVVFLGFVPSISAPGLVALQFLLWRALLRPGAGTFEQLVVLALLGLWLIAGGLWGDVARVWAWNLAGEETISVDVGSLCVHRKVWGRGRTKE